MKKSITGMFAGLLMLVFLGDAGAYSFSDLRDFDSRLKWGRTSSLIKHGPSPIAFSYGVPAGEDISYTDAMLTISHRKNKANKRNQRGVYLVTENGEYFLGNLVKSKRQWENQEFINFSEKLLQDLAEGPVSLEIRSNKKKGKLWVDEIVFDANYNNIFPQTNSSASFEMVDPGSNFEPPAAAAPVPEPATMLLLGAGLAGLAGFRKRTRKPLQ